MASPDIDIRLYTSDGKRKYLPTDWIQGASFETGERGGCLTGSLEIGATWDALDLDGTEYVDIRLWGVATPIYRGWLRTTQDDLNSPERANPQLIGLIELLNGWRIPRDFCYGVPTNIDNLFRDIITLYVAPNMPGGVVQVSTTGIVGTGILVQSMDVKGKTVSQAFNAICDASPGQLIWGGDVDSLLRNRLYLYPRSETANKFYSVGGEVTGFVYPRDATTVVNKVYITGGKADAALGYPPNLIQNASFEDCVVPGAATTNLLANPAFDEDNGGTQPGAGWLPQGDPSTDGAYARSSPTAAVFDNNPSDPEGSYQDISVGSAQAVKGEFWGMTIAGETWDFEFILQYWDGAGPTLLDAETLTGTPAADNVYRKYSIDWPVPIAIGATFLRFVIRTTAGSGAHGLNVDDCAMWYPSVLGSASWEVGGSDHGGFNTLDWGNAGIPGTIAPYEGGLMLLANPVLYTWTLPFAQIRSTMDGRASVKQNLAYTLTVHCKVLGADCEVALGADLFAGDTYQSSTTPVVVTVESTDDWLTITSNFTTGTGTDKVRPFLQFRTDGEDIYVDAWGLYEGDLEPDLYYPGDTIEVVRTVGEYSLDVSAEANASLATWGLREGEVNQDTITTKDLLDAFCPAYFNAFAVPNIQARLEVDGAERPIALDGTVRILNLANRPPDLFPSKVHYDLGDSIKVSADLSNERPDLAILLRQVTIGGTA